MCTLSRVRLIITIFFCNYVLKPFIYPDCKTHLSFDATEVAEKSYMLNSTNKTEKNNITVNFYLSHYVYAGKAINITKTCLL